MPGEGKRAGRAVWRMSTDDVLTGVNATVTGVLSLDLKGTVVNVNTLVKVR